MAELEQTIYGELRAIAAARMRGERQEHTLQATALVHEAYLRISALRPEDSASRAEFFAAASEAMRRVLIEHARGRGRQKRGGDMVRLSLDTLDLGSDMDVDTVLELDEALRELATLEPRAEQVVRLRFFGGLKSVEIAEALSISERSVRTDWAFARAWLYDRLK